jgi:hypothetical protein
MRKDGQAVAMTFDKKEKVQAWFRRVTDGVIESISIISVEGQEDEVWMIVNRTINAGTKRYVEYMMPHNIYSTIADGFFVDCGLTTTLVTATQIPGLTHLALKTVAVVIAGVYIGTFTVSAGGVVTLGGTYSGKCHVGLPYTATLKPMKMNFGSRLGTARGKKQRINKLTCCFYESAGGKYGPNTSEMIDIPWESAGDSSLHSVDVESPFVGDWLDEATIVIQQTKPLPMTVMALAPNITLYEGTD